MLMHQVLHDEPRPPRKLNDRIPRDLETVCLKAMSKDVSRRYATAGELAADLRRWLAGEPILARPAGRLERAWVWVRRHPARAGLTAMTVLTMLALVAVGVSLGYSGRLREAYAAQTRAREQAEQAEGQARAQEGEAKQARLDAERALGQARRAQGETHRALGLANTFAYFHRIALADTALRKNNVARAEVLLDECPRSRRDWEWRYLRQQCRQDLLTLRHDRGTSVVQVGWGVEGRYVVSVDATGTVALWHADSGKQVWSTAGPIVALSVSRDGKLLAVATAPGTVHLWELPSGKEVRKWSSHGVGLLAFDPTGQKLAGATDDRTVNVWKVSDGARVSLFRGHTNLITALTFSPDGRRLASASWDGTVRIHDLEKGKLQLVLDGPGSLFSVAWGPDGERLASAGTDRKLRLYSARDGKLLRALEGHTFTVREVAFSPDGQQLASCARDGTVRTWDLVQGRQSAVYRGHHGHVHCLAYHPDGNRLLSGGDVGLVKLWDVTSPPEGLRVQGEGRFYTHGAVRFFPDGKRILTAGPGHLFQVRDAATGRVRVNLAPAKNNLDDFQVAVSPDGQAVFLHETGQAVEVREASTGKLLRRVPGVTPTLFALSPDGKLLALASAGETIRLLDARTARAVVRLKGEGRVTALAFSCSARWLASAGDDRRVRLWQLPQGKLLRTWGPLDTVAKCLVFAPNDRLLTTAHVDGTIRLLDPENDGLGRALRGHSAEVEDLRFHPSGTRLLSGARDRSVRLWDVATGQEALGLPEMSHMVHGVDFDPKGDRVVALDQARRLMIFSAEEPTDRWQARRRAWAEERTAAWQREQGASALGDRQWFAAEWFFDRLLARGGTDVDLFAFRGLARAGRGRWPGARDDLARSWKAANAPLQVGVTLALLHHQAGAADAHRAVLTELLRRRDWTRGANEANTVAWACARFPAALEDYGLAEKLARAAVASASAGSPNLLNTLGAVQYRAGKAKEAMATLQRAIRGRDGKGAVEDWVFLALAQHKLGKTGEARESLARARQELEQRRPTEETTSTGALDYLEATLLVAEASTVVGAKKDDGGKGGITQR
jgi:WD40 repeat protein/tetratricopeptide (TPR) repeat protein